MGIALTADMVVVLLVLAAAIGLFISDRVRPDFVALGVLAALLAFGILTPAQALQGFASTTVFIIATLFVVGGAVFRTGLAERLSAFILRAGGASETRLLLVLMLSVAAMSTVISSTGVVALLLPAILSLGARAKISSSRLLIPVAFAALVGGSATLIGTPPNLIVSEELQRSGQAPFGFFDFTPMAMLLLLVLVAFVLLVGRRSLPRRTPAGGRQGMDLQALVHYYHLDVSLFRVALSGRSLLVGRTLAEAHIRDEYGLSVLSVEHHASRPFAVPADAALATTRLMPGDVLIVQGSPHEVEQFCWDMDAEIQLGVPEKQSHLETGVIGVAEVMLRPRSSALGRTLRELNFGSRHRLNVLRLRRADEPDAEDVSSVPLQFGDLLVVSGAWADIFALGRQHGADYIVLGQDEAEQSGLGARLNRAPLVVGLLAAMVLLVIVNPDLLPLASLLAALGVVAGGALTLDEAYTSLDLKTLVLVAAMIPLSTAMDNVGLVGVMATLIERTLGTVSPLAVLAGLFAITALMTQVLSNTVTTVLLGPLALSLAARMGVAPQAFLMAVAMAASMAFASPIGSPVNMLIMAPGNYRFMDFARLGIPLIGLGMLLALLVLPALFPF